MKNRKGKTMNFGTKLRTILAIATSLNTALLATDLTGFNNGVLDMIYKVASVVLNFVIVACVTYYNNDYTPEGQTGTQIAREMKELRDFETEYVEEPEDAEVIDDDNC